MSRERGRAPSSPRGTAGSLPRPLAASPRPCPPEAPHVAVLVGEVAARLAAAVLEVGEAAAVEEGGPLAAPGALERLHEAVVEAWHTLLEKGEIPLYRLIPYKAIGKPQGILKGIEIDYMVILEGENSQMIERPIIAVTKQPFTGIFHYSILLHSDYF